MVVSNRNQLRLREVKGIPRSLSLRGRGIQPAQLGSCLLFSLRGEWGYLADPLLTFAAPKARLQREAHIPFVYIFENYESCK